MTYIPASTMSLLLSQLSPPPLQADLSLGAAESRALALPPLLGSALSRWVTGTVLLFFTAKSSTLQARNRRTILKPVPGDVTSEDSVSNYSG